MKNSNYLYQRAKELMPGGVNSPVRAFRAVGGSPLFIDHAKGSRIYDVDGNSYLDYVGSWGALIFGHAHERIVEAVKHAAERGLTYGAPTELESELAELITAAMPDIEMLRLVNSGTEAVMSAVRLARGYTGRDKIVKFEGCYHGHSDGLLVKAGSGLLTNSVPDSAGIPAGYADNTLIAEYNNIESVRTLFERFGEQIACVIVEPVAANMGVVLPEEGFLPFLRQITEQYGALLLFDEVITGFRVGYGGAAEYYRIHPDLITLGKIVGGGLPLAVYGGKRRIMSKISPLGEVYQAGTLSGNPVAVSAGIAALKLLSEDRDIYRRLEQKGARLEQAFRRTGLVTVNRIGSLLGVFFTRDPVCDQESALRSDTEAYARYFRYMLDNGIYLAPSQFEAMFVSDAHTEEDLAYTVEKIAGYRN